MPSSVTDVEFEAALSNSLQHIHHISSFKREQKLCLEIVAHKRDLFGILQVGFWKSLIFQLLPHLLNRLKELWKLERVCVLLVTLLVSIMKDQVEELTCLGLRAFAIGLGDEKGEKTFNRVSIFIAFHWRTFTSRWSNCGRLLRTTSWCFTLIRWIYQLLQMFIATACYYCAKMNHTNDFSGTRKARQFREIHSTV